MNTLKAGFAQIDITPPLGTTLGGYFETRYSQKVLDKLEATVLAVSDGTTTALMLSLDILYIPRPLILIYKDAITLATGIPADCIYLHGTHIHTGPSVNADQNNNMDPLNQRYLKDLGQKLSEVCVAALADLKPARMGWAVGKAPNVAFIRRFRMKDGSVATNPGINNPNIDAPIGEIDDRVNILRFDREGCQSLVLVNFGNHPDVVGGKSFSADWPGFLRRTTEAALPECRCIFFNGCQGDVNHVNVHPKDTDRPLTFEQDECYTEIRYGFARYIGRAMAGTVLQEYDKVKYIDVDSIRCIQKKIQVPTNMPDEKNLPQAHSICDMLGQGRIEELRNIYPGMMFETVCGEARRMVMLENGPEFYEMELIAISIGKVAFVGIPGEPFSGVSFGLKEVPGWEVILPTCCTNGADGYFPTMDAYLEGAYEARSSRFKAGVAEKMVSEGTAMLNQLAARCLIYLSP